MSKKFFIFALFMCNVLSSVSTLFGYTDFYVELSTKEENEVYDYGFEWGGIANVTASNLNLRSKPDSEKSKVMGQLSKGEEVYATKKFEDSNGDVWYLVSDAMVSEFYGWVSGKYLRFASTLESGNLVSTNNDNFNENSSYSSSYGGYTEEISAETFLRDWAQNPMRAEKNYKGKTLRITGNVEAIEAENSSFYITFKSYFSSLSKYPTARCFVSRNDPLLSEINTGGYITIQGYVSDVDAGHQYKAYTLTKCKIVEIHKASLISF